MGDEPSHLAQNYMEESENDYFHYEKDLSDPYYQNQNNRSRSRSVRKSSRQSLNFIDFEQEQNSNSQGYSQNFEPYQP